MFFAIIPVQLLIRELPAGGECFSETDQLHLIEALETENQQLTERISAAKADASTLTCCNLVILLKKNIIVSCFCF